MKILITGGHLAPALAVIEELVNKANPVYVGKKYAEGRKNYSLEYLEISRRNITFHNLETGRFTRLFNINLFLNILKLPLGFYQAFRVLIKERPDAVLSFGSYLGFPVSLIAFLLGIPVFIHEQTAKPGISNRIIAHLAKKIFISFQETQDYFPRNKTLVTGNPVKKAILTVNIKPFQISRKKPVLYITGGSLGSQSINDKIKKILPRLLAEYLVIHQTGNTFKPAENNISNYYPRAHFLSEELGYIYSLADLVIGRSGANTVFELIAWKKPSILIPLPWSANREQMRQAKILEKAGVSEIFNQDGNPEQLLDRIEKMTENLKLYKNNFKELELLYQENAAKNIVRHILASLKK